MTDTHASKFIRTIRQKTDAAGRLLPIWFWRVQQGDATVAFGERRSEQGALSAAQIAERNFGSDLKASQ